MTDTVKVLTDDEVERIRQLPVTMNGNIQPQLTVVLTPRDRGALCQTVRVLRAELNVADDALDNQVALVSELRGQLAQMTQERDELQRRNEMQSESIMEFQSDEKSLRSRLLANIHTLTALQNCQASRRKCSHCVGLISRSLKGQP